MYIYNKTKTGYPNYILPKQIPSHTFLAYKIHPSIDSRACCAIIVIIIATTKCNGTGFLKFNSQESCSKKNIKYIQIFIRSFSFHSRHGYRKRPGGIIFLAFFLTEKMHLLHISFYVHTNARSPYLRITSKMDQKKNESSKNLIPSIGMCVSKGEPQKIRSRQLALEEGEEDRNRNRRTNDQLD